MSCDCGRVPESFPEPASRWVILPGDPVDLRRWLREKQAGEPNAETTVWPDEESA